MIKRSPIARRKAPKKANRKRKAREFERAYHSKERVLFVRGLPCCACKVTGYSENAHVPPKCEAGVGYKADAKWIVPLCGRRRWRDSISGTFGDYPGCHGRLHGKGRAFLESKWGIDLTRLAAETEAAWQSRISEKP